jgi:hypothetical protein
MEFTNFVFVLNTDAAVTTFINSGTLTLGGNISIAFGTGRSAETAAMIGTKGVAGIFAYSKTRGVYGGLTLEGGMIVERSSANKKLYDRKLKAKELLTGEVPPPPQAEPLMRILNSEAFRLPSGGEQSLADGLPASAADAQTAGAQVADAPAPEVSAPEGSVPEVPAVEASRAEVPIAEAPVPESQAADVQVPEVQTPEAVVAEPSSQQPEGPAEPVATGAVPEIETTSPQAPSTEKDVQNASPHASTQPIEDSVIVQHITEENTPEIIHDVPQNTSGATAEGHPPPAVDTQPPDQSQPQPNQLPAALSDENLKR